jgi:hypothetical protein
VCVRGKEVEGVCEKGVEANEKVRKEVREKG